ncbi:BA14K family protein [Rhizobium sp. TRM95111]|uniref:BA14K family protein n=1 Tax=Rhizobium alarense TaxID=2846851 RepID=UPI001F33EC16|nr:BA14K family protein [Rhizobium alarense]MCF3640500.1 BA14K family protein [Rhizobium alarense]
MRKFITTSMAAALAVAVTVTGLVPAPAMAMPRAGVAASASTDVETVQYRYRRGYYRGHRGYRYARPGYRRWDDGYWYPYAAFGTGVIIGGAIASQPRVYRDAGVNPRHVEWCYARYRSYRAYDNTFQPYGGPRQQCLSPYY